MLFVNVHFRSFGLSVYASVHMKQLGYRWANFGEMLCSELH